jgi:hypothetical protein
VCKKRRVDYKFVPSDADWTDDSYLKVSNQGSKTFQKLDATGLVDSILSDELFQDLLNQLKKKNSQSDRGSTQLYAGYASLNQKLDDIHSVTAPQMINSMNASYAKKMVEYTSLIRLFCSEFDVPMPYSDDPARTKDWSQRLCDVFEVDGINLIEQVTFALTCLDDDTNEAPLLFGSHVDQLNDQHWPEVFCVYKHFFKDGRLYRLAAIAYSRSIIRKYRFKDQAYECLKKKIISYLQSPSNKNRMQISMEACVPLDPDAYMKSDGIRYRTMIPFLDKAGFYSGFVDAILKVWNGVNLERMCELLILVGWLPTASTFQKILTEWSGRSHLPEGHWTLAYINEAVTTYKGLTRGPGHRCQPWMNRPLMQVSIMNGLITLREAILNTDKTTTALPYARLHQQITDIGGIGPLGAQHVIGVASLLGVIHPRYQTVATIAEGTTTAKKYKKLYNLSVVVLEKQKTEVAIETDLDEKTVEGSYCEMGREEPPTTAGDLPNPIFDEAAHTLLLESRERSPPHPDVFFHGQILRTVRNGKLVELLRDGESKEASKEIEYVPPKQGTMGLKKSGWLTAKSARYANVVIPTTITNANDDAIGRKVKRRIKTRKKVTHSGFGVHRGLEERLKAGK